MPWFPIPTSSYCLLHSFTIPAWSSKSGASQGLALDPVVTTVTKLLKMGRGGCHVCMHMRVHLHSSLRK